MVIYQTNLLKDKLSVVYLGYILYFGGHFGKSALTPSPRVGIFADNLISIDLCIRFPKMFVCENPPGGAWGVRLACRLSVRSYTQHTKDFIWGKSRQKETGLAGNRQEQAWRMKYLLTEIKWMNIRVKIHKFVKKLKKQTIDEHMFIKSKLKSNQNTCHIINRTTGMNVELIYQLIINKWINISMKNK